MAGVYETMRGARREDILNAAKTRICRGGIAGTTMKDIANDLGISRQTLYKYFSGIDTLAYAVQKEILRHMTDWRARDAETEHNPFDAIQNTLTAFFRYAEAHPEDFLFVSIFDAHYSRNAAAEGLREDYGGFLKTGGHTAGLTKMIARAKDAGFIAREIDPAAASVMAANACFAVAQRLALLGNRADALPEQDKTTVEREFITALMHYLKK